MENEKNSILILPVRQLPVHGKRNSEAIKDYNKAIELNPGYAPAYYKTGDFRISIRQ
jgi:hypothetical protein